MKRKHPSIYVLASTCINVVTHYIKSPFVLIVAPPFRSNSFFAQFAFHLLMILSSTTSTVQNMWPLRRYSRIPTAEPRDTFGKSWRSITLHPVIVGLAAVLLCTGGFWAGITTARYQCRPTLLQGTVPQGKSIASQANELILKVPDLVLMSSLTRKLVQAKSSTQC